jgi:hypothetical protein
MILEDEKDRIALYSTVNNLSTLHAIHSHLYSFALIFLFLQTQATSYSFYNVLLYTVYCIPW